MPGFTCCVPGCYNNSHRDRELRFYTFPKDQTQREIWLKNISRAGVSGCFSTFQPTTGHRVCSVHFPGGRKTYTVRVPTLFPLRGVNERRSRRGRGRKAPAVPVISSVVSLIGETETAADTAVIQIGQNGQYIAPEDTSPAAQDAPSAAQVSSAEDFVSVSVSSSLSGGGEDHSYSLTNGTTSAELLRKLNEQRDIIALMEVKMKEMKNTIRQLRVSEAHLQEELRERDRLLTAAVSLRNKKSLLG
ncbi:THAP domain-containing protein 11 [Hoplias malabaricus]|uniref:THAP domain-containing protein 11 n=1 Tax=Hoplias malabaricus TaxID=27720 RepID=UPI0034624276